MIFPVRSSYVFATNSTIYLLQTSDRWRRRKTDRRRRTKDL